MSSPARRAIVAGLDGASMELVKNMADAGHMPNVRALMKAGVWRPMVGVLPHPDAAGLDGPVHRLVARDPTGSWTSTSATWGSAWTAPSGGSTPSLSRSEYIWNAFERGGKMPILVKWEMSWPPTVRSGVQVEGTGPRRLQPPPGGRLSPLRGRQVGAPGGCRPSATRRPWTPSALQGVREFDPVTLEEARGWIGTARLEADAEGGGPHHPAVGPGDARA